MVNQRRFDAVRAAVDDDLDLSVGAIVACLECMLTTW
jgi:hypothetical protein